jgi:hypothetical protein
MNEYAKLVLISGALLGDAFLDVFPDLLIWIELRRIRRQEVQFQFPVSGIDVVGPAKYRKSLF